ncbi:hypothetical protein HCA44_11760 [Rhodococcus sp. HNM0569]|nr:hypothetical protein [Rhodococcus sp. HNM0569]
MRHDHHHHHVIELGRLRPTLLRGARLLLETVVVPTLLLYACSNTVGQFWGLVAVLAWCALTVSVRLSLRQRVPGTLLLAVGMLVGRTSVALAFSSVYVYLFQPIAGSLFMAALFIGSALVGKPVTARLAQDFVSLPAHLFGDHRIRKMFVQVALLWGASRLIDAGMSVGSLHFGLDAGLLSRGILSTGLTIVTIGVCTWWGWSRLRRMPGISFRLG